MSGTGDDKGAEVDELVIQGSKFIQQCQEYFPVKDLATSLLSYPEGSKVNVLDFNGVDQVNDQVCMVIWDVAQKSPELFQHLHRVQLVGCVHLTDYGIGQLILACGESLEEIHLDACHNLTDATLVMLKEKCSKLKKVTMAGTSVCVRPEWGEQIHVSLGGCPLIPQEMDSDHTSPSTPEPVKLLVMAKSNFPYNVVDYLQSKNCEDDEQWTRGRMQYIPQLELPCMDVKFNAMECHCQSTLFSPFMSAGAVYVVATVVHEDDSDLPMNVMSKINAIRAVSPHNVISVLAFYKSSDEGKPDPKYARIQTLGQEIESYLTRQIDVAAAHLEDESYNSDKMETTDFQMQQRSARNHKVHQYENRCCLFAVEAKQGKTTLIWSSYKDDSASTTAVDREGITRQAEMASAIFQAKYQEALEAVRSLNKSDITELKSFTNPPRAVQLGGEALVILLGSPDAIKQGYGGVKKVLMRTDQLMASIMNYDYEHVPEETVKLLKKYVEDEQMSRDKLQRVSKAMLSLWMWVVAVYAYCTVYAKDIRPYKEMMSRPNPEIQRKPLQQSQGPTLVLEKIQAAVSHVNHQQLYPRMPVKKAAFLEHVDKELTEWTAAAKVISFEELLSKLRSGREVDRRVLTKVLQMFVTQGKLLFYPDVASQPIIRDVGWLMQALQALHHSDNEPKLANGQRCRALPPHVSLFTNDDVSSIIEKSAGATKAQAEIAMLILQYHGIIACAPKRFSQADMEGLNVLTSHLNKQLFEWESAENGSFHFTQSHWPEFLSSKYLSTDVQAEFGYRFTMGFPLDLWPRIFAECSKLGYIVSAYKWAFILRCGAADVQVRHNIVGVLVASSIDITARMTRFADDTDDSIVQQYLWSIVSTIIVIVDYMVAEYPNLLWRVKLSCQGRCAHQGVTQTFLPGEVVRKLGFAYKCNRCNENGMTPKQMGYTYGRQRMLPVHDFRNSIESRQPYNPLAPYASVWKPRREGGDDRPLWLCQQCGISDRASAHLWRMESKLFPTFGAFTFVDKLQDTDRSRFQQDSCLFSAVPLPKDDGIGRAQEDKPRTLFLCKAVMYLSGIQNVHITVIKPGSIKLILNINTLFHDPKQEVDIDQARLVHDLCSGQAEMAALSSDKNRTTEMFEKYACQVGDTLTVAFQELKLVETEPDVQHLMLMLNIQRNQETFLTIPVRFGTKVAVLLQDTEEHCPQIMLQSPEYPMVTSAHFPLGSGLLHKTGVGNQWAVSRVNAARNGQLHLACVGDDASSVSSLATVAPCSTDILPLGSFMDGLSVQMGKEILKSRDQLQKFLEVNKCDALPMSLFHAMDFSAKSNYRNPNFTRHEARYCTVNIHSPQVLAQISLIAVSLKQQRPSHFGLVDYSYFRHNKPVILLPSTLNDINAIVNPMRHNVQDWTKQQIHYLCHGHYGGSHLMSISPVEVSATEVKAILLQLAPVLAMFFQQLCGRQNILPTELDVVLPDVPKELPYPTILKGLHEMLELYKHTMLLAERLMPEPATPAKKSQGKKPEYGKSSKAGKILTMLSAKAGDFQTPCTSHKLADRLGQEVFASVEYLSELEVSLGDYAHCVTKVSMTPESSNLSEQPAGLSTALLKFLGHFPNVETLHLTGLSCLDGISACRKLKSLVLLNCSFRELPAELAALSDTLEELTVRTSLLEKLPGFLTDFHRLRLLSLRNTLLRELPEDLGRLWRLRELTIQQSLVTQLPKSFEQLQHLERLALTGVPWMVLGSSKSQKRETLQHLLTKRKPMMDTCLAFMHGMSEQDWEKLYNESDTDGNPGLSGEEINVFHRKVFEHFPRIGYSTCASGQEDGNSKYGGVPPAILKCLHIRYLDLKNQAMLFVPDEISQLRGLTSVEVDGNYRLESLSSALGKLRHLGVHDCPMLKTPPKEILAQGIQTTIAYLKRLSLGSIASSRSKLMFVGLGGAGKTSLMRALMSGENRAPNLEDEGITDGIDISMWSIRRQGLTLTYSVWDFAGQTVYYNIHQFFMSNRAVYILVWNTRLGYEHAGLDFWLSSVACHCPQAPVFIVGTHADKITKPELPAEALLKKFPNIQGFFIISSLSGDGVEGLRNRLVEVTMQQPYIGEMIPEAWLHFERHIIRKRNDENLIKWKHVAAMAETAGIYGSEIQQAVQFLHDMGTLQHFDNVLLRDRVVINPQWIVDVMACVVSVHNSVVKDGRLKHRHLGKLWKDYPSNLYEWLLRLTEVFDLTFPLEGKKENIVPCLLPPAEAEISWPVAETSEEVTETKMIYKFEYLPAGLFNRAQVRLYQYSEESAIWKTGSVLKKNGHHALIKQTGDTEVLVKAFGPRPENIILLVHEIFEGLIADFFQGVKYEFQLPCVECVRSGSSDPDMFTSTILRNAVDMKVYFLQCHKSFHTLSLTDVQGCIPPQSGGDYDLQLHDALRELNSLEGDMQKDIFFLFCRENIPSGEEAESSLISPAKIKADLEERKFKCWYAEDLFSKAAEEIHMAVRNAKVIVVFISDEFVADAECERLFLHVKEKQRKDMVLLMVGQGREWRKSTIGGKVIDQVFINFQRVHQYEDKLKELVTRLEEKLGSEQESGANKPEVFLSYCWVNSASAISAGQAKEKDGSLGHGDPRAIKQLLGKNGIRCWMDIEQVGRRGLFEDIAEGMKRCKLVIACVSDEYALSDSCQMEFRFAHVALRRPMILCVVGTGYRWESTEIGMLSLGYPKINFQVANRLAQEDLLAQVKEHLDTVEEDLAEERPDTPALSGKEQAFQELYELAQRKFLRQISGYTDDSEPYPRLFVADLSEDPSEAGLEDDGPPDGVTAEMEGEEEGKPTFESNDLRAGQFCIKLLCEHEKSWHTVDTGIPVELAGEELVSLWELAAPYMARVIAILKHSNINLHIINSTEGHRLIRLLEKRAGVDSKTDMLPFYTALRRFIMSKDPQKNMGQLRRCYLPNGKYLWLCPEHQRLPRVSVIGENVREPAPSTAAGEDGAEDLEQDDDAAAEPAPELLLYNELQQLAISREARECSEDAPVRLPLNPKSRPKSSLRGRDATRKSTPGAADPVSTPAVQSSAQAQENGAATAAVQSSAQAQENGAAMAAVQSSAQAQENGAATAAVQSSARALSHADDGNCPEKGAAKGSSNKQDGQTSSSLASSPPQPPRQPTMSEEERERIVKRVSALKLAATGPEPRASQACTLV